MKDNISTSFINNRKIVIELRYEPSPKILDVKGSIIDGINELGLFSEPHWQISDNGAVIKDGKTKDTIRNQILIELNRFAFISSKIETVDSFYSKFNKMYSTLCSLVEFNRIVRIGCRIQGTYKTKSTDFDSVMNKFVESFPQSIFIEDFPYKDLLFELVYQNGMYRLGPIKEDDPYLQSEFPFEGRKNDIGFGIDTDNFLLCTKKDEFDVSKIQDVLTASLAVEKSLFEKLKDF